MRIKPFEDEQEVYKIKKERDELLEMLKNYKMSTSEKKFIIKRIEYITKILLEKAQYAKKI